MASNPLPAEFRCYAKRVEDRWVAHCVDLSLTVTAPTLDEAMASLDEAILGYLESVFDTEDTQSIFSLVPRPSPWTIRLEYHWVSLLLAVQKLFRKPPQTVFRFTEPFPKLHHSVTPA